MRSLWDEEKLDPLERDVKNELLVLLSNEPETTAWVTTVGKYRALYSDDIVNIGPEGAADVTVLYGPTGDIAFIETKTRKGTQRESQKRFERMVKSRGGLYLIARDPHEGLDAYRRARAERMNR